MSVWSSSAPDPVHHDTSEAVPQRLYQDLMGNHPDSALAGHRDSGLCRHCRDHNHNS